MTIQEGREKQSVSGAGREEQKENTGTCFLLLLVLAEGEICSLHNDTCWVIRMQPRLSCQAPWSFTESESEHSAGKGFYCFLCLQDLLS